MPEGHTLHRLARDHHRGFAGQTVRVSSPQGRFEDGAALLDGSLLIGVQAVGKHLLYRFQRDTEPGNRLSACPSEQRKGRLRPADPGGMPGADSEPKAYEVGRGGREPAGVTATTWLHVHLGLFGKFRVHRQPSPARPTVRLRLEVPGRQLDLTGPTDCALWDEADVAALRERLGPDPLDPDATLERFAASVRRRRKAIGAALLDQEMVAGIGNVYRAELLFLARIDPHRAAASLTDGQIAGLWADMCRLLELGVRTNRIITTDPADFGKPASKLLRHERTWVYKRAGCRVCAGPITREELGARTLYWCPGCQSA